VPAGENSAVLEIYGVFSRAQAGDFWNMLKSVFGRMKSS
jgi:hypothetical protein